MDDKFNRVMVNGRIRVHLAEADRRSPGSRAHAERVAVYAVSTAERLGFDHDRLFALRLAAELYGLDGIEDDLKEVMAEDELSRSIVDLCRSFDNRRFGYGGQPQMSDADCVEWLSSQTESGYSAEITAALTAVQSLIQPAGT